jgi:DNA polymerase-1
MARKTLYLIDGHAQIYRAYYAPFGALTSPSGEPTRAVHVFMQMLLNLLRDRRPDYLAMTMDVSDETVFRVDIDPTYKANRQASPEDLGPQIERIVSILQAMKIPILRQQGFEADDLIATLCRRFADDDLDIFIVSKDKDLDQLLGDHVRMHDPGRDFDIDVSAMIEAKGYGPDQAIDAQMLMGDSTDNVKGVPGVGPKKAAQLLQNYGTVENVIAHADELTPRLRENMLAFRERMETVRRLVTLRDDVALSFDLADADVERFEPQAGAPILAELGLKKLLDRVGTQAGKPAAEAAAGTPASPQGTLFSSEELTQGSITDFQPSKAKYELIDTDEAVAEFADTLARTEAFAFDTETTSLTSADADIVGLSFSFQPHTGFYVPVRGIGRTVSQEVVCKYLGPIFADARIRKCGQNLKYDVGVLMTIGIEVRGIDFDTMIAGFVLEPLRRSHGIDSLALELLNYRKIPTHELIGKGKKQVTFDQLPVERVRDYAAEDADVAWQLRLVLDRQLKEPELRSLFDDLEMPLLEVLALMEYHGVAVDTRLLAELSKSMADRLTELEYEVHAAAGHPFNVNSTQQLGEVLFDELNLRVVRKTKTARSTDAEVLATLANETASPIPQLVLEHRELSKLKGTYADALPEMVSKRTGRIHPSFHQTGAVTGRLSCSDPNLQNIPIRTDLGSKIRRAFVPGHPDELLLKADYSQIELRVLAHLSHDRAMCEAFAEDRDIHTFVAAQIADVPIEAVTREQRSSAKSVNFGIVYGQSAFGLSRQTGMPLPQARAFIDRYFRRYPGVRVFLDDCIKQARLHGEVKTLLGRRRPILDINSRNQNARQAAERLAVNSIIQGTAADMIKRAMVNIHRRILSEERPCRMLIQVHDELVFEVRQDAVEAEAEMIAREMTEALPLSVPVKVDVAVGANWLDAEPLSR